MVTFVCRTTFLKIAVISAYFEISGKFPLFTVSEDFCERLRVYTNRVKHDFNWNFFESKLIAFIISSC